MEDHRQNVLVVETHPLLDLRAFVTVFPRPLADLNSSPTLLGFLSLDAPAPLQSSDEVRTAVRDLLRQGGFKPTGRSKPASEYLIKAADRGSLSPIDVAVDACNAVSFYILQSFIPTATVLKLNIQMFGVQPEHLHRGQQFCRLSGFDLAVARPYGLCPTLIDAVAEAQSTVVMQLNDSLGKILVYRYGQ